MLHSSVKPNLSSARHEIYASYFFNKRPRVPVICVHELFTTINMVKFIYLYCSSNKYITRGFSLFSFRVFDY